MSIGHYSGPSSSDSSDRLDRIRSVDSISSIASTQSAVSPPPSALSDPASQATSTLSSTLSSSSADLNQTGEPGASTTGVSAVKHNYAVATHTVRITKHGYAIDPLELKYPEITNKFSLEARRSSDASFEPSQTGHKILELIRGYWSQPAFPKGRQLRTPPSPSNEQARQGASTIDNIIAAFKHNPLYPHKNTFGSSAKEKPKMQNLVPIISNHHHKKSAKSTSTSKKQTTQRASARSEGVSRVTARGKLSDILSLTAAPAGSRDESPGNASDADLDKNIKDKFVTLSPSTSVVAPKQADVVSPPSSMFSFFSSGKKTSLPVKDSSETRKHAKSSTNSRSSKSKSKSKDGQNTYRSWIPKNKDLIAELISDLCQQVGEIFANESRVLRVRSPCVVLGDIHGNLTDLRAYERSLWPKAPVCVACNYLFLGDYVDRGEYSVECILYLFAMKLISPDRFFLLRGNHEVAAIQRQYTFGRECESKFGLVGRQLWRAFNKVFDMMPIVATIDDQIYCAHGGIPRSVTDISQLADEIPMPLDNPELQSPAAWEILWNDPITDAELVAMIEMDNTILTQTQAVQADGQQTTTSTTTTNNTDSTVITPDLAKSTTSEPKAAVVDLATSTTVATDNKQPIDDSRQTAGAAAAKPDVPSALSSYIKPADQDSQVAGPATTTKSTEQTSQQQVNTPASATQPVDQDKTKTLAAPPPPPPLPPTVINSPQTTTSTQSDNTTTTANANANNETTLRKMPSDTSSIASSSPQQIFNDGFVGNIKRGTAFLFSDQAINNFLRVNKLSHVIRAHEVIPTGFAFHGDGRVITIFSSSKYCGLNNQAACVLVDRDKIRIMRLDTADAGE